jgi:hypothetical protein
MSVSLPKSRSRYRIGTGAPSPKRATFQGEYPARKVDPAVVQSLERGIEEVQRPAVEGIEVGERHLQAVAPVVAALQLLVVAQGEVPPRHAAPERQ